MECYMDARGDEPCWGELHPVDDFLDDDFKTVVYIYSCQGHSDQYFGAGPYLSDKEKESFEDGIYWK